MVQTARFASKWCSGSAAPAGVAPLASGDALVLSLAGHDFTAWVA